MIAQGTFVVSMKPEPPYDSDAGVTLARASFDKTFAGALTAVSTVQMLAARTAIENSAGYVAIERIVGSVAGRTGSFVVVHVGLMNRGARALTVQIVPDSGTQELTGIAGSMSIEIVDAKHTYQLDYTLPPA